MRICRDSGTEKRLSSVPVPEVKVGIYQHKRKIPLQAGHPVTIAVHTQLPSSIYQAGYLLSLRPEMDLYTSWLYEEGQRRELPRVSGCKMGISS